MVGGLRPRDELQQLCVGWTRLAVMFDVGLGCFSRVVRGMLMMALREVRVMTCRFVIPCFMM